jgi:hypothetical protein
MESPNKQLQDNRFKNAILNDPIRARRIAIKKAEEKAAEETRNRKRNAPKTTEERILFVNK